MNTLSRVESGVGGEMGSGGISQDPTTMVPSRENEDEAGLEQREGPEWSSVSRVYTTTHFSSVD